MKIIDGNRFALDGAKGEVITVTVEATGTTFLVVYRVKGGQVIDGPSNGTLKEGTPLRFTLDNTISDRNTLSLGFTFASPSDVSGEPADEDIEYDVRVTGSAPGSDVSREVVRGSFGIPGDNRQWRFRVA
jgi:hypothetical protein